MILAVLIPGMPFLCKLRIYGHNRCQNEINLKYIVFTYYSRHLLNFTYNIKVSPRLILRALTHPGPRFNRLEEREAEFVSLVNEAAAQNDVITHKYSSRLRGGGIHNIYR